MKIIPVVLCGGSGTRLWPVSRAFYPKPFVQLNSASCLFQDTVQRVMSISGVSSPYVVCNAQHRVLVETRLEQMNCPATLLVEPVSRNTAPAIALAAFAAQQADLEAILFVVPSDQRLNSATAFAQAVSTALSLAQQDLLVTFGITPTGPETGYGYIQAGQSVHPGGYGIECFIEKPTSDSARVLITNPRNYWNAGMFVFEAGAFLRELKAFAPEVYARTQKAFELAAIAPGLIAADQGQFSLCPSISIDYAVMEKTDQAAVVPLPVDWQDLGTWSALYQTADKDSHNNAIVGDVVDRNSSNCYLHSTGRLIATIGLNRIAVIETKDAVVVSDLNCIQEVKEVVAQLKAANREEINSPPVVTRAWGTYEIIARGEGYQVKRLLVAPGKSISRQYHHQRSETWTVVSGTIDVCIGQEQKSCRSNESVYIPVGTIHRLSNTTQSQAVVIEVQQGSYLGEDDIVRLSQS